MDNNIVEQPFKNKGGRPLGSTAQTTQRTRTAIAKLVEGNTHRLEGWLDRIAEDNPKDAFNCFMSVIEYHIPKLARSENVNLNIDGDKLTKEQRDAAYAAWVAVGNLVAIDADPAPIQTITQGVQVPVPVVINAPPIPNIVEPTPIEIAKEKLDAEMKRRSEIKKAKKLRATPPPPPFENPQKNLDPK